MCLLPFQQFMKIINDIDEVYDVQNVITFNGSKGNFRKKITQVTRYLTVLISAMQAYGIVAVFLPSMSSGGQSVVINPGFSFIFTGDFILICPNYIL